MLSELSSLEEEKVVAQGRSGVKVFCLLLDSRLVCV